MITYEPKTEELEKKFAKYFGYKNAINMTSVILEIVSS